MGTAFAFGLGMALGALLAFRAGRRYQDAHRASQVAAEYLGVARERWHGAASAVVVFAAVVAAGVVIMIFA